MHFAVGHAVHGPAQLIGRSLWLSTPDDDASKEQRIAEKCLYVGNRDRWRGDVAFSAYTLPVGQIDRRFIILGLAMLIGSRITIEIPRAKGHISVSDTFVFLTLLLFGGQAAVLLAATEALTSSRRFSKKPSWRFSMPA